MYEEYEAERVTELVRSVMGDRAENFKPVSYTNFLDRLYVVTRDCSHLERHYPNTCLIMVLDTHTDKPVGFIIESAKQFCSHVMGSFENQIDLTELLDSLEVFFPEIARHIPTCRALVELLPSPIAPLEQIV